MTYEEILRGAYGQAGTSTRKLAPGECQSAAGHVCELCSAAAMEYTGEVGLKDMALREFWQAGHLPGDLQPTIPSPRGRAYRTVSKRKVFASPRGIRLALLSSGDQGRVTPVHIEACAIEPPQHAAIYHHVHEMLLRPYAAPLVEVLQYVVIKGNYREFAVVLNVREMTPSAVKAANTLSKSLSRAVPSITGFFLYEDESSGNYYMGSRHPGRQPGFRKLFGKDTIYQKVLGKHFLFSPLSFSQVNLSIADLLVGTAGDLLRMDAGATFYDFYCGYGLFAICLAGKARHVMGVELSPASIASAKENAERNRVGNARFFRNDITEETIERVLQRARPEDAVLLDPPRNGTAPGVIEAVAGKKPHRAVHLFCNIDIVHTELERWRKSGYAVGRVIPFDMFPGTSAVELMAELQPG